VREAERLCETGDNIEAANIFLSVGAGLSRRRRYMGATTFYEQAAKLFEKHGELQQAVSAYVQATNAHLDAGHQLLLARHTAETALELANDLPLVDRLEAIATLGRVCQLQGDVGRAQHYYNLVRDQLHGESGHE